MQTKNEIYRVDAQRAALLLEVNKPAVRTPVLQGCPEAGGQGESEAARLVVPAASMERSLPEREREEDRAQRFERPGHPLRFVVTPREKSEGSNG